MNHRKVVLIGATGLIGKNLLDHFIKSHNVGKVTIITRRKIEINHPKLEQLIFPNFSSSEIENQSIHGDIFVNCLGTTMKKAGSKQQFNKVDHDYVLSFARLALKNYAKSFITISSLGASSSSSVFYNCVKGRVEDELLKMDFESLYLLRPSLLIGKRVEKRVLESFAIEFYKLSKYFIPSVFRTKLGTEVESIIKKIDYLLSNYEKGKFIIEKF